MTISCFTTVVGVGYTPEFGEERFAITLAATAQDNETLVYASSEQVIPILDNDYLGPNPLEEPAIRVVVGPAHGSLKLASEIASLSNASLSTIGVRQ